MDIYNEILELQAKIIDEYEKLDPTSTQADNILKVIQKLSECLNLALNIK